MVETVGVVGVWAWATDTEAANRAMIAIAANSLGKGSFPGCQFDLEERPSGGKNRPRRTPAIHRLMGVWMDAEAARHLRPRQAGTPP